MNDSTEHYYTMALTRVEGIGAVTARRLLKHFGSGEEVFRADRKDLLRIENIGTYIADKVKNFSGFEQVEKELRYTEKNNIRIITLLDPYYPELLKHCTDAPVVLFAKGSLEKINDYSVSIVGTRNMTGQGADFTKSLVEQLKEYQPTVVSGYAFGVDICAHLAALEHQLGTIAVLGHGLQNTYPALHKKYNEKILENGLFLTEFWSGDATSKENFVQRNRIVAGLTQATIVIESAKKGGSLITAKMANDYNREVFAMPGRIHDKLSEGCNYLIKTNQAQLITSAEDVAYYLNWNKNEKNTKKVIQPQLFADLDGEEQKIYDYLSSKSKELLDVIAIENAIPVYKLSTILLNLELKGLIKPQQGKWYQVL